MPIQVTNEGLVIAIEHIQNPKGEYLIGENFWFQLSHHEGNYYIHLWNQWGIITPKPVLLKWPDCIVPSAIPIAIKAVSEAKGAIRMSCNLLVHKESVIIGMKLFALDEAISKRLITAILNRAAANDIDEFEIVQFVIS